MGLRDHAVRQGALPARPPRRRRGGRCRRHVLAEAELRPLVGTAEEVGVIDPDVLWSCTTCGACVEQCPVDIEHIDHIMDMRRYQVMIESQFPTELGGLFKNLESKGNPWGMNASTRNAWIRRWTSTVRVVGADGDETIPADVEWLFWVGCAGALRGPREEDHQGGRRAAAHRRGRVRRSSATGETCTGDPARRSGNEFLFQMLAQANVEVLNGDRREEDRRDLPALPQHPRPGVPAARRPLRGRPPHPAAQPAGPRRTAHPGRTRRTGGRTVTYHDPCYLGRHNKVYTPPRELLGRSAGPEAGGDAAVPGASFCCGAGGARMWMEERIGIRINAEPHRRGRSAPAPTTIATACPFCRVMISDGVTALQQDGGAQDVEVLDVAQLLLRAVRAPG